MNVTQQDLDALKARLGSRLVEAELQAVVMERMLAEALTRAQRAETAQRGFSVVETDDADDLAADGS